MSDAGQGRARGRGRRGRRPEPGNEAQLGVPPAPMNAPPPSNPPAPINTPAPITAPNLVPIGRGRARARGVAIAGGAGRGRASGLGAEPTFPPTPPPPPHSSSPHHPDSDNNSHACSIGRGIHRGSDREMAAGPSPASQVASDSHRSVGRGVHRGGGREMAGPPLVSQMASMSLGQPGSGRGGQGQASEASRDPGETRRQPWERYVEPKWHSGSPKAGKAGNEVKLLTNYTQVSLPPTTMIYQYHVVFNPVVESIKVKCALVFSLAELIGPARHFDGSILFLTRLLSENPLVRTLPRTFDGATIEITITKTADVPQGSPQFLQIANGLLNRLQEAIGMKRIREHYFNMHLSARIPAAKLEVMPGFTTAIGQFDAGSLMNLDIVHKILRVDTFYDVMGNLYEDLRDKRDFQARCLQKYVGTIVLTRYNNKTYKVDDIAWDKRVNDTFDKNGTMTTYVDYYRDHWNLEIHDVYQPLLITRPTERDRRGGRAQNHYLVPELCTITGFDDETRMALVRQGMMNQLALHTRIGPERRVETIEKFLEQINSSERAGSLLNPWGMSIGRHVMEMTGRQLKPDELMIGGRGRPGWISYGSQNADWSGEMRGKALLNPVTLNSWLVIYPDKCRNNANDLVAGLKGVAGGFGMGVNAPQMIELRGDRNEAYLSAIRAEVRSDTQMVVLLVPNDKKDRYDAIKKCLCIEVPVPSQVVQVKTVRRNGFMSISSKILIQMNCKLGGEVWGSNIPEQRLMVIGIDSYHDSLHKNSSVGAMVASLNKQCTRYYSKTEVHDCKVDTMSSLAVLVSGALRKYYEVNGGLPNRIVLYRDGVGDGQLRSVFQSEKEQLDQAFGNISPDYKPELAFVVVKKRINTRFFIKGRNGNPQAGTVVDSMVTKPDWYDFFLVSQSVRQGTVTPTSYNVIYDTIDAWGPDVMQRLTYKMTHLYFNWQGTIRVPAPCQYAHKLAYLQGQSLHREPSASLADKLFYL